jgi:hypothetical protein
MHLGVAGADGTHHPHGLAHQESPRSKACRAAATAFAMSVSCASATRRNSSSVAGAMTSMCDSLDGLTQHPRYKTGSDAQSAHFYQRRVPLALLRRLPELTPSARCMHSSLLLENPSMKR